MTALGALRERPTALRPDSGVTGSVRTLAPVEGSTSAATDARRAIVPRGSSDGPRLTEADLFAAYSVGVREAR